MKKSISKRELKKIQLEEAQKIIDGLLVSEDGKSFRSISKKKGKKK